MRNIVLSTLVMALALVAAVSTTVTLTGAAEVPGPGDRNGSGTVKLTVNPDKGEVCYELTVANMALQN